MTSTAIVILAIGIPLLIFLSAVIGAYTSYKLLSMLGIIDVQSEVDAAVDHTNHRLTLSIFKAWKENSILPSCMDLVDFFTKCHINTTEFNNNPELVQVINNEYIKWVNKSKSDKIDNGDDDAEFA